MPAIAPASWLLAMSCAGHALQWPWEKGTSDERTWAKIVSLFVGVGLVVGGIGYPLAAVALRNKQQVKKAAAEINALVPSNETLYAVDPEYQPVFFYVTAPLEYVSRVQDLPADARFFVIRGNKEAAVTAASPRAHLRARVHDYRKRELILFEVGPK
jgi:hypothetical protein